MSSIVRVNEANIMTDDALAPGVTRPSAHIVLILYDEYVFDFNSKSFKSTVTSLYRQIKKVQIYFPVSSK